MKPVHHSLLFILAATFIPLSAAHAQPPDTPRKAPELRCDNPVFYAQTANHKKDVEICLVPGGVSYRFGVKGAAKPEMFLTVPLTSTSFAWQSGRMANINEFIVNNADISYSVMVSETTESPLSADLYVHQGDKQLASIRLDTRGMINNITPDLADKGVPESDSF